MILKEIEVMKKFTKLIEKKFITRLSVKNQNVGTTEKEKESKREYPLVLELLKSRVSTVKKNWLRRMLLSIFF